ncbi:MAG: DUF1501 domain-containing protein [Planctomycetota bacterium]|nr:DUF1501 domain-containing protein [Planctomycetota bacterium]MDA1177499.1 DUF1501 domain-containing protein [Planctomycetota bacterium]
MKRRDFLQRSLVASAAAMGSAGALSNPLRGAEDPAKILRDSKADSMVLIWLPGGVAQTDMWDPKRYTPYEQGMKGSELLGTCESISTAADGIRLGKGLESIASVMDQGAILRSLTNEVAFGAVHLKAQYYMMTGYLFPVGVKAPSLGAVVGRSLGRRNPAVPEYIYIGRDVDSSDSEKQFISEYIGPGFYGVNHGPFMIPDPTQGLSTLEAASGMTRGRLDRRQQLFKNIADLSEKELKDSPKAGDYLKTIEDARAMMDSPVKAAFNYRAEESAETIAAYEPRIEGAQLLDPAYDNGRRFGHGLLLARRLLERGARFIQVEYQYGPFKGFDMHENGGKRMVEMKQQIDGPIAKLIQDLRERGMLERTLVVLATEFGRTIASQPAAGAEPDGSAETHTGENLVLERESMYGFHGHFSSTSSMVFFGGGIRQGYVHGKTADRHPLKTIENPVALIDAHATIYHALGIPPDTYYTVEDRPFFVTKDGKGVPVKELLA